jgi:hypothetical protein
MEHSERSPAHLHSLAEGEEDDSANPPPGYMRGMQDPKDRGQMLRSPLKNAWITAEKLEMEGLTRRKCWVRVHRSTLTAQDKVFHTRFHHTILHGKFKKCQVRLVVQGQHMHRKDKQGRGDFEDAFSADRKVLDEFRTALLQRFEGTYEGEVHTYLGREILRELEVGKTLLSQKHYAEDVLCTYDYWDCIPALTPMTPGNRLTKEQCDPRPDPAFHRRYRDIVGSLGYLVNMTRPDLAWSYSELSKYVQNPGKVHMDAAHHVLRYLRATYDQTIVYERTDALANTIWGWVDSDWAADLDSRRSHTGFILMLSGGAVSWKSRRQDCVSLSTSEAEYVATSQCGQEVVYLREILRDFGFPPTGPTRIYEDNLACVAMSENLVRRKYSRHIDICRYFVRDLVAQQVLKLVPLRTNVMVADTLTKSLPSPAHAKHRDVMIGRMPFCARTLRPATCVVGG